jgi:hypothetical protein
VHDHEPLLQDQLQAHLSKKQKEEAEKEADKKSGDEDDNDEDDNDGDDNGGAVDLSGGLGGGAAGAFGTAGVFGTAGAAGSVGAVSMPPRIHRSSYLDDGFEDSTELHAAGKLSKTSYINTRVAGLAGAAVGCALTDYTYYYMPTATARGDGVSATDAATVTAATTAMLKKSSRYTDLKYDISSGYLLDPRSAEVIAAARAQEYERAKLAAEQERMWKLQQEQQHRMLMDVAKPGGIKQLVHHTASTTMPEGAESAHSIGVQDEQASRSDMNSLQSRQLVDAATAGVIQSSAYTRFV